MARLATTARTWDELLETVVDRTRDALHADVSSLYLLDRDGAYLTLAATNGLDRFQIGRARVPFGEGVTGPVRGPRAAGDPGCQGRPRFLWVRGLDQRRFVTSMLSVPLCWHDQTVGVLNVQTEETAASAIRRGPAGRGRRPAGRDRREGPPAIGGGGQGRVAQGDRRGAQRAHRARHPRAADPAGDRPGVRRPAADEPPLRGRESRDIERRKTRAAWHGATLEQIERLDRLVDSILASVRVVPEGARRSRRWISGPWSREVSGRCEPCSGAITSRSCRASGCTPWPTRRGSARSSSTSSRTPSNTRRPTRPSRSTGRSSRASSTSGSRDEGPGIPDEWRERIFEPYARRDTHTARGSGIGLYAAKRLGESMGAHLWCEPAKPHGARFVVAMPAAVAI